MSSTAESYKENFLNVQQQTKNVGSVRKHQTKKQVFGELKNVIHNQGIVTPLKADQKPKSVTSKSISQANIQLKQQYRNEYKPCTNLKTQKAISPNCDVEDLHLDNFDFRGKCCLKADKSDQQIWSEMNLYSDKFLDNIFDAKKLDQIEDILCEDFGKEKHEAPPFSDDEKDESDFIYWPDKMSSQDEADIHLAFEKPNVFDFSF